MKATRSVQAAVRLTAAVAWLAGGLTDLPAQNSSPKQFVALSAIDGMQLRGQVDRPTTPPRAIVAMFPGSGTHTRDTAQRLRGAAPSFVFRDLSERLRQAGFATVRYDERGLRCREGAEPDTLGRCFDDQDARTISWPTLHSDALAIYHQAEAESGGHCIIALGHSEGLVHVAELIGRREANPTGVIAIGSPFGPLENVLKFQHVDLVPQTLRRADADHDGIVTRAEFVAIYDKSPLTRFGTLERITWPKGWTWPEGGLRARDIDALRSAYVRDYQALAAEVLSHADTEAYQVSLRGGGLSIVASYEWQKRFFSPGPPVVRRFAGYGGQIATFFGGIDGHIDSAAEIASLRAGFPAGQLSVTLTADVGHALGPHSSSGPMRVDQQDAIVEAALRMSAACETRPRAKRPRARVP